ncbi:hypothetical protein SUGI_0282560 [Cryptomeria japonica]|nr:hypothetical protein SUGI_0282560 [Cryptomeria japonica]
MLSERVMPPTPQMSSASPIICGGMPTDSGKGEPAAVMTGRRNEAELHITSTRKYRRRAATYLSSVQH